MSQTKEQDKTIKKKKKQQLSEMEIGTLTEKEFRVMRVKMIQHLKK